MKLLVALASIALAGQCLAQAQAPKPGTGPRTGSSEPAATPPAGTEPPSAAAPEPAVDPFDRSADGFLAEVAQAARADVQLGALAMERAASDAVKDLGRRVRANDTAVLVILGRLAESRGSAVPADTTQADDESIARLSSLQGEAFDKAYMMLMAERHANLQSLFRWQYEHCSDEAVKPFVMGTLPAVASHARIADELNKKVNAEEIKAAEEKAAEERRLAAQKAADEAAGVAPGQKKKRQFTPKK